MSIQLTGRLLGRNVVIRSLNVVINVVISNFKVGASPGKGKITNKEYQGVSNISERTATRDLSNLVSLGLFMQIGVTGKGTEYILTRHKDAIKTPSGQSTCLPWWESLPAEALAKVGEVVRGKQVSSPTLAPACGRQEGGRGGI